LVNKAVRPREVTPLGDILHKMRCLHLKVLLHLRRSPDVPRIIISVAQSKTWSAPSKAYCLHPLTILYVTSGSAKPAHVFLQYAFGGAGRNRTAVLNPSTQSELRQSLQNRCSPGKALTTLEKFSNLLTSVFGNV